MITERINKLLELFNNIENAKHPIITLVIICFGIFSGCNRTFIPYQYKGIYVADVIRVILISFLLLVFGLTKAIVTHKNKVTLINKTKLPGVGIFIQESIVSDESINANLKRNLFVRDLKKELNNYFEVKVYEAADYQKYKEEKTLNEKIFEKYNLSCAILVNERAGFDEGEKVYTIEQNNIGFHYYPLEEFNNVDLTSNLANEMNSVFDSEYIITNNNDLNDSKRVSLELHLALDYITTIVLSLSQEPMKAEMFLKSLEKNLRLYEKSYNKNTKLVDYLIIRVPLRKIDYLTNDLNLFIDNNVSNKIDTLVNKKIVEKIKLIETTFSPLIYKGILNNDFYKIIYINLLIAKTISLFYLSDYDKVLETIDYLLNNFPDNVNIDNDSITFIMRFGSLCGSDNCANKDALAYFKRNRKKYNGKQKEMMLHFIQELYEYNEDNMVITYVYYTLNYYYKDKLVAEKLKEKLLNDNTKYFYDVI